MDVFRGLAVNVVDKGCVVDVKGWMGIGGGCVRARVVDVED